MAGVDTTGFTPKLLADLVTDINNDIHSLIDPTLDLSADQPLGQLIGIFANKIIQTWELANVAYNQFNRQSAEGLGLDNVGALTGTPRLPATATVVNCTVNLNAGVTLPQGSKVSVAGTTTPLFDLKTAVTNSGGSPANVAAVFVCESTGPVIVNPSTLTNIVTPVSGWNSVTNALAGTPGTNVETDTAYRTRQVVDLNALGSCDLTAIVDAVAKVTGVIQVIGFENTTLVTDANNLPGKSFEIVVWDGASPAASNTDIATAIWNNKPSGIQSYGTTSATITDSQGIQRTVSFSRSTQVPVYMTLNLHPDTNYVGDTAVINALVAAFLANQQVGTEVRDLYYKALPLGMAGNGPLTDVVNCYIGTSPSPASEANLTMGSTQIATLVSGNITINHV